MPDPIPLMLPVEQFRQTRYRCPYCRRSWTSLRRANEHRDGCWYRPGGCKTCRHAETTAGWVNGCELGEQLLPSDEQPELVVPRTTCALWEAAGA